MNLQIVLKYFVFWYAKKKQQKNKHVHSILVGVSMGTSKARAVLR